jgi:hypothetical protein
MYGQLGCTGFIVLDSMHQIVSKCTSSFMQVRDLAFRHVDALIDLLESGGINSRAPPAAYPGEYVRLKALHKKVSMNGKVCLCVGISPRSSEQDWIEVVPTSGRRKERFRIIASNVDEKVVGADQLSCVESIVDFVLTWATSLCPMLPPLLGEEEDEDECAQGDCDPRNKLLSSCNPASCEPSSGRGACSSSSSSSG